MTNGSIVLVVLQAPTLGMNHGLGMTYLVLKDKKYTCPVIMEPDSTLIHDSANACLNHNGTANPKLDQGVFSGIA